ncbi:Fructosamine/Ketosamine-3-kinase [Phascolomyces articulosus]|uniref:protein-ribulosamine 3-kinase n=1 Tax=Phascolomyces articulosus TaxID=60185 RepID=A0AAD5JL58_9FUNG|nr:Fructosamine/Ketosamine-3-kinase [Phascolomyces articulosus]
MTIPEAIKHSVTEKLQQANTFAHDEVLENVKNIGGGCISDAYLCTSSAGKRIFVKTCQPSRKQSIDEIVEMFASEVKGLKALVDTKTIKVPTPYAYGSLDNNHYGYLAMEYIPLGSKYGASSVQRKLGEQLASLHLASGPKQFGFECNNTIGSTPQDNTWCSDWVEFLRRRLTYQFDLAIPRYPQLTKPAQELLDRLDTYFDMIPDKIQPSLQHGDLWSGNWNVDDEGNPVIIDPAPFWGHNESDLGIMKMFGGFVSDFYKAYHEKIPKQPGYEKRVDIYALYHTVNHLNMFGSSYLGSCMSLLSEILK